MLGEGLCSVAPQPIEVNPEKFLASGLVLEDEARSSLSPARHGVLGESCGAYEASRAFSLECP